MDLLPLFHKIWDGLRPHKALIATWIASLASIFSLIKVLTGILKDGIDIRSSQVSQNETGFRIKLEIDKLEEVQKYGRQGETISRDEVVREFARRNRTLILIFATGLATTLPIALALAGHDVTHRSAVLRFYTGIFDPLTYASATSAAGLLLCLWLLLEVVKLSKCRRDEAFLGRLLGSESMP